MTQEIQLRVPDNVPALPDPASPYEMPNGEHPESIFVKVHRLLRGRYKWCILLGMVFGALGVVAGYKLPKVEYVSTGMIRVKPVLPPVLTQIPETGLMPMYDAYVQTQVALIKSQRVIDMAMGSEEWRKLGRPGSGSEDAVKDFNESLAVVVPPRSENILISFTDPDRGATVAAVNAVMSAYNDIYVDEERKAETGKRTTLDALQKRYEQELKLVRDQIRKIAEPHGTDDLRGLLARKMQTVANLETALNEVNMALPPVPATQPTGEDTAALSREEIAMRDPSMRQLLREKQTLEMQIKVSRLGQNHPRFTELRTLLQAKEEEIEFYTKQFQEMAKLAVPGAGANLGGVPRQELERRESLYKRLHREAETVALRIGTDMLEVDRLRKDEQDILAKLEQTNRRLEALDIEAPIKGRIELMNTGIRPMVSKDKRKQMAGAGGVGGIGLGFGIVLLFSLMDRRLRTPGDAASGVGRLVMLGVLPTLPEDLADPEQAAIAAHCVHQVRALLQIGSDAGEKHVFAMTSPAAGTGKTSLTLALGVSFAAANSKTLMIDCDIVGGGLTARVDVIVRRKIGQILRRQGLVSEAQLAVAMKVAQSTNRRLGEVLVELGYLSETDVMHALMLQKEGSVGLLDALAGEDLSNCVAETGIDGLSILPIGAATPNDVSKLSLASIRRLIEQAQEKYDTILIDTGPVPGSLEASMVAAVVDGVVLVVSRGEHRPLAEKCVRHLRDIGAPIAGMVFNRAETRDMEFNSTTARIHSVSRNMQRNAIKVEVVDTADAPRYGPIALAVASTRGSNDNGRGDSGRNGHDEPRTGA